MPQFCAVSECGSRSERDSVGFFRFPSVFNTRGKRHPRKEQRRQKWILATKREDLTESILKNERICSKHFITGKPTELKDINHSDWIPSISMGYKTQSKRKSEADLQRHSRKRTRYVVQESVASTSNASPSVRTTALSTSTTSTKEVDVSEENVNVLTIEAMEVALRTANETIYKLRDELKINSFEKTAFEEDDTKCRYYTGLPYKQLWVLYEYLEPYITETHSSSSSKFKQFILTLIKLRLNTPFKDLGYRCGIDRRTVSRIFFKILHVLYVKMKPLIVWPEPEILHSTMPRCFQENFGKRVTVIIDCFEIYSQTPSNKQAAAIHFSNYKHHNTIKFLIGIAPQGAIVFISEAFSGRASDKFVVENSDFLRYLKPGDLILADRGFLINDQVKLCLAEVQTPAFLKGKKQLHPKEIEETRKLANVRIHIERVIGVLRQKYKILSNIVPILTLKTKDDTNAAIIDKIVNVCCALTNLCPSVVPY